MSALPNPLSNPKKSPGRAARPSKLNQYGRDPQSPGEQLRRCSDYDTEKGYAPFYHAFLADIPRLSSGNSCTLLLLTLWSKSAGRGAPKGQPRPDWTLALSVEDLASICCCDVRTVERELVALDKRGLAEVKRPAKGAVEARLKIRDWEALPNYKSAVVEMPVTDETAPEVDSEDEAKPGNQRVTGKKPVRLAAGAISQVFPVSCGVKSFRHKAEGPVDLEFSCVIQAGELLVVSRFPDDWREKVQKQVETSNGFNQIEEKPRHGCRGESQNVDKPHAAVVVHPRTDELVKLFDPLLQKSGSRLLSPDSAALQIACAELGSVSHDFLVHFILGPKGRGSRPISGPRAVASIIRECRKNWEARESGPAAEAREVLAHPRHYSQAEVSAAKKRLVELEDE